MRQWNSALVGTVNNHCCRFKKAHTLLLCMWGGWHLPFRGRPLRGRKRTFRFWGSAADGLTGFDPLRWFPAKFLRQCWIERRRSIFGHTAVVALQDPGCQSRCIWQGSGNPNWTISSWRILKPPSNVACCWQTLKISLTTWGSMPSLTPLTTRSHWTYRVIVNDEFVSTPSFLRQIKVACKGKKGRSKGLTQCRIPNAWPFS